MSGKKKTPCGEAFGAKYREKPRAMAEYLNDALSTNDPVHTTKAIGNMVRTQGVTRFSQKTRLDRTGLYRSFRGGIRPSFETVLDVLTALDIQLIAKPSAGL